MKFTAFFVFAVQYSISFVVYGSLREGAPSQTVEESAFRRARTVVRGYLPPFFVYNVCFFGGSKPPPYDFWGGATRSQSADVTLGLLRDTSADSFHRKRSPIGSLARELSSMARLREYTNVILGLP